MPNFIKLFYEKIFLINDTPQRIALGFGLGVFTGILPGAGLLAAAFLALILRVNRASAILGSLLTNTWLSFILIIPATKIGAFLFGIKLNELKLTWVNFLKEFSWIKLFQLSILKLLLPLITGFIITSLILGLFAYLFALLIIKLTKKRF